MSENSLTTDIDAGNASVTTMRKYIGYTWQSKFPNVIDGLKPILRRILLSLHNNPNQAKEATVTGRVMEMHPHGDSAISDAIAGLAQPFGNIIPLVDSDSNLGTYTGEKPAAPRYVLVEHSETAEDLFFRNTVFSSLHIVPCESEEGVEPETFVPTLPTTLLIPSVGIGCGFSSATSAISVAECCALAKEFVRLKFKVPGYQKYIPDLSKYMLPDFPSFCILRNSRQIVSEYKKGNYMCPFVIDGIIDISKDRITITTLPPDKPFGKVTTDFGSKVIRDKTSWMHEHFAEVKNLAGRKSGSGSIKGNTVCMLRRGENPFEVLSMFKKAIQLTSSWTPNRIYFQDGYGLVKETPVTLLEKWAEARYNVVLSGLKRRLSDIIVQIRKLQALIIIVDHAKEVADIFIKAKTPEETVKVLVSRFREYELTEQQARYLQTLQIQKFTAKGKQELLDEIDKLKEENRALQKRFTQVPEEMIANIQTLENKYAKKYPPKCNVPRYIGTACYKDTGWIMITSLEDADEQIIKFGAENLKFNLFRGSGDVCVLGTTESDYSADLDLPRYIHATYIDKIPCRPANMAVRVGDGVTVGPIPKVSGLIQNNPVPVGTQKCTVVIKNEGRRLVTLDNKIVRRTLDVVSPSIKGALAISPIYDDDVIVVHGNTSVPGTINIDRVTGNRRLTTVPVGKTIVVGIYAATPHPILLSLPQELSSRSPFKHLYIKDITGIVGQNSSVKLLLTKKRTSNGDSLAPMSRKSTIYTIVKG